MLDAALATKVKGKNINALVSKIRHDDPEWYYTPIKNKLKDEWIVQVFDEEDLLLGYL